MLLPITPTPLKSSPPIRENEWLIGEYALNFCTSLLPWLRNVGCGEKDAEGFCFESWKDWRAL